MIKIFDTLEKYNTYTNNGQELESGFLYYVKEDGSTHYYTNNIDGVSTIYDNVETPTGNIEITANGTNIDVADYATATVDVPIPEGYIIPSGNKSITANGENIDVNDYATATVNVPIPPEYIVPTGNKEITENGTNIDVAQYATASVAVQGSSDIESADSYSETTFRVINYLKKVTIPEGVTIIDQYSFMGKNGTSSGSKYFPINLEEVVLPSTLTSIGESCFKNYSGLTGVTIPNSVTSIGASAFQGCTALTSINIPSGVTSIGESVFQNCSSLTSITIPSNITTLAKNCFMETGLTNITIPSTVTSIGTQTLSNCQNLLTITVDSNNTTYDSRDNSNAIIETATNTLIQGCKTTIIPNTVTTIGNSAFRNYSNITSITIPSSVTSINEGAFGNCTGINSITIPSSVTSIGNEAFSANGAFLNVTVEATTPPTLGTNVFYPNGNRRIYVPAESVEAYKAASGWSTYASQIEAIPTT